MGTGDAVGRGRVMRQGTETVRERASTASIQAYGMLE